MCEGASVLMADISESALGIALSKVKKQASSATGRVETITCDVSKEEQVERMCAHLGEFRPSLLML